MSISLIPINPLTSSVWDDSVTESPNPQFFHQSCWLKTLIDTYKFKPFCFMVQGGDGGTVPFLIVNTLKGKKKAVALPFSDSCDISSPGIGDEELSKRLLLVAKEEGLDRLEFRGVSSFRPSGECSHSCFGHRLQLSKDEKKLWKNLSSSKQRNIKKSQKENISVTFNNDTDSLKTYYRLHCITRKRHGLPPQPLSFFEEIQKNILTRGYGEIGLAHSVDSTVAGAVYLFSKTEVLYKFGASDKNLQFLRANDLLMWEAINRYTNKGYETFSFGKTEKFHEGLCRFKEGFGAQRVEMNDFCYDVRSGGLFIDAPGVHGIHNKVFGLMPIPLLRLCGELLYKYSA